MYRLAQKHCTKFSNEKSMVFSPVNLFEILHANTYNIYNYIYKVEKNATTSGRPPAAARRSWSKWHLRALYIHLLVCVRERVLRSSCFLALIHTRTIVRAVVATTRVAKMAISQGCYPWHFFGLHICNCRCHRHLHANFQEY